MPTWLAMDIGCIECGEPSGLIGVFETKQLAEEACDRARDRQQVNWGGQHHFIVLNLTDAESISAYADKED